MQKTTPKGYVVEVRYQDWVKLYEAWTAELSVYGETEEKALANYDKWYETAARKYLAPRKP